MGDASARKRLSVCPLAHCRHAYRSVHSFCCPAAHARLSNALEQSRLTDKHITLTHRRLQDRLLALSRRARQALERELQGTNRGASSRGQRVIGDALGRDERGSLSDRAIRILEEISNLGVQVSVLCLSCRPAAFFSGLTMLGGS